MNLRHIIFILLFIFSLRDTVAQVNFVGNPSFEVFHSGCTGVNWTSKLKYWGAIDSAAVGTYGGGSTYNTCYGTVPYAGPGIYQQPRTGNGYARITPYCSTVTCIQYSQRIYPKNRLLSPLTSGATYCVKMWVNLQNNSPYAIDALQIYFGDATVDTIKYCNYELTYLTPQISNTLGVIPDTLKWTEVKGTFVANGTEKYLLIGNFKTDAATASTASLVGSIGGVWSEYHIDDISVIDFNLSVTAGPDKNINLGDSAFIGITPEVGLENTWTTGSFTVGTGSGLWVKPTSPGTYSYVVTQDICGNIKTDTVNVNVAPSLISEHTIFSQSIGLFPQPANDIVRLTFRNYSDETVTIEILDTNGKTVYFKNEFVKSNSTVIPTDNLSDGIYYLKIKNSKDQFANKKLTVTH
jgi:hypothetical protein